MNASNEQLHLINSYNHYLNNKNCDFLYENISILTALFPEYYLEKCVMNLFPEYYLSSFSTENDNASMWGKYADGHRGICLIFSFDRKGDYLTIETEKKEKFNFYEVKYNDAPPEINFFENLGHLPREILDKFWLYDGNNHSKYSNNYGESFPEKYWNRYGEKFSYKFSDWKHEKEYRIVKNSLFSGRLPKEQRICNYQFKYLKGIIFGLKTPQTLKYKIIEALEKKIRLHQRLDFKFYQANFCYITKKIEIKEMAMLEFK